MLSDLQRWLAAEQADLQRPKRIDLLPEDLPKPDHSLLDADSNHAQVLISDVDTATISDGSTRSMDPHPELAGLPEPELARHCRSIASKQDTQHSSVWSDVDALIAHFEREAETESEEATLGFTVDAQRRTGARRRLLALQAILEGVADRAGSHLRGETLLALRAKTVPYSAQFAQSAGIEILIPPSHLLRIHNLLCDDDHTLQAHPHQALYRHLSPSLCYMLATRIAISQRPQLFGVFYQLMQQVKQSSEDWSQCIVDPRELVFILRYCLHDSVWKVQGGSHLARDLFSLLLSREQSAEMMRLVEQETKLWLPRETRRPIMIHLFAHLLVLRSSILANLPTQAVQACKATIHTFGSRTTESRAVALVLETCETLLAKASSLHYEDPPLARFLFQQVRELLWEKAEMLISSDLAEELLRLEAFCVSAIRFERPFVGLRTLVAFVRSGWTLGSLITPKTLISLINSIPQGVAREAAPMVKRILGTDNINTLPSDQFLLGLSTPLRGDLLASLRHLEMKLYAASLYLFWLKKDKTNRSKLVGDAGILLTLVKEFSRFKPPNWRPRGLENRKALTAKLFARTKIPANYAEGNDFCVELIAAFIEHKPFPKCSHYDLTSLASAHFLMGQYTEGFKAFKRMVATRQVPNAVDVAVLVRALGDTDLGRALELYIDLLSSSASTAISAPEGDNPVEEIIRSSGGFTRQLRGNYGALYSLVDRCFLTDTGVAKWLDLAKHHEMDESNGKSRSLTVLLPLIEGSWEFSNKTTSSWWNAEWRDIAERATTAQRQLRNAKGAIPSSVAMRLVEAAVNGLSVSELMDRRRERAEYVRLRDENDEKVKARAWQYPSTKSSSPFYNQPNVPLPDSTFNAAVSILDAMDKTTASTSPPTIDLFLRRLSTRVGLNDKCCIGAKDMQQAGPRKRCIAELDRIVKVIRRMESRTVSVPTGLLEDAKARRPGPLQVEPTTTTRTDASVPAEAVPRTMLHPVMFRTLIRLYLHLGDIQGASEVFLWMKNWFAIGCFRSGRWRTSITGAKVVRLGLGRKLANDYLKPLLGDLKMLERDEVPSWTFEGNKIEKTKMWWSSDDK